MTDRATLALGLAAAAIVALWALKRPQRAIRDDVFPVQSGYTLPEWGQAPDYPDFYSAFEPITPSDVPVSELAFDRYDQPSFMDTIMTTISDTVSSALGKPPIGIRINNPGNLREVGIKWQGKAVDQTPGQSAVSGAYTVFDTPLAGMRAMIINLKNQYIRHGLNTVRGIIEKYAPPSDNNPTEKYVQNVAAWLSVSPNAELDMTSRDTIYSFSQAIIRQEHGHKWLAHYEQADLINAGIDAAGA